MEHKQRKRIARKDAQNPVNELPVVSRDIVKDVLREVPLELVPAYNALYNKIIAIIGGQVIDIRNDPTTLRIIIQTTMDVVEKLRNENGAGWNGPEKRRIALTLIKLVLANLAANGKIDPVVAAELIQNADFYFGVTMDIAVSAAKKSLEIGKNFIQDEQKIGCKESCKKNCCYGLF